MKTIAPDYYRDFKCISDRCRHSCCIGWEIDIDPETAEYYKAIDGELGEKLKNCIKAENGSSRFVPDRDERCPFLQRDGLCEIISKLGEESLCQICADHPRFRNFFADSIEIGLGLCCEASAELITKKAGKTELIILDKDGFDDEADSEETKLLSFRQSAVAIAQDREFTVEERLENLQIFCGFTLLEFNFHEWADTLHGLERLSSSWDNYIELLRNAKSTAIPQELQIPFEQLLVYFLYRHVPSALYDGDINSKIGFAIISIQILAAMANESKEDIAELARMYSAEIEYSDENLEIIFEKLTEI